MEPDYIIPNEYIPLDLQSVQDSKLQIFQGLSIK